MKKITLLLALVLSILLILTACGVEDTTFTSGNGKELAAKLDETAKPVDVTVTSQMKSVTHYADIDIKDYGTITVALDAGSAPITVENFVTLAKDGFYDGVTFHRIIKGFMMQGGDPLGNGTGGSDKNIKGEFAANGVANELTHVRGAISMARSSAPDSASSQFFIVHEDSLFLDGNYAVFGYVTSGIGVVDAVCNAAQPTDGNGSIAKSAQPVINKVTIRDAE